MPQTPHIHYVHRVRYSVQERLVGLFVLTALTLVLLLFVYSREAATLFADKFTIYGLMDNAEGVARDSKVIISGVEAGRVKQIDVASARDIRIEMELLERFHPLLHEGARATLDRPPMLGTPRIVISSGDPQRARLPPGSTLRIEMPRGLEDMLADVGPAIRDLRQILEQVNRWSQAVSPEDIGGAVNRLHAAAEDAASISRTVAAGQGVVGQLLAAREPEPNVADTLTQVLTQMQQRLEELQPVVTSAQAASADLPQLIDDMQLLTTQLNAIAAAVNLEVAQLPDLVLRTRLLMEELDTTLNAAQDTWPLSLSVPDTEGDTLIDPQPLP